ncbi:MAG: hypothetical protein NTX86_00120 [Candidatus Dependentiae bacterium]|nr:hypothetical protein [Candidatus Dependentiae bacterium]
MKTKNITFSLPIELVSLLQASVGKRELSKFATQAIKKALEEKNKSLKSAYAAANEDPDRIRAIKDWESLDSESEGWE